MNENMLLRASLPTQIGRISTGESPTLFESNIAAMQARENHDGLADYRLPAAGPRGAIPVEGASQARLILDNSESNQPVKTSDSGINIGLVAVEIAAVAVFARLGLKHLAKNGITFFEGAGGAAKNLANKIDKAPGTISPTTIAELNPTRSAAANLEQHIPRIRTYEREGGPLRVG